MVKLAAAYLGFFLLIHLFLGRLKICRVIQFLECLQKILVNEGGNPNVMAPFSKLTKLLFKYLSQGSIKTDGDRKVSSFVIFSKESGLS